MNKRLFAPFLLIILIFIAGLVIFFVSGNGSPDFEKTKIYYGTCKLYTKEDIDECVSLVFDEAKDWEISDFYSIKYAGDERCKMESDEAGAETLVLLSDFHTKRNAGGGWNANDDYNDWGWIFEKTKDGHWELKGWGYA